MSICAALTYRDDQAAIQWLDEAFGVESHSVDGCDRQIDHAVLESGDGMVMVVSERLEDLHSSHTTMGWICMPCRVR